MKENLAELHQKRDMHADRALTAIALAQPVFLINMLAPTDSVPFFAGVIVLSTEAIRQALRMVRYQIEMSNSDYSSPEILSDDLV